jgi:hypothetical protein
MKRCTTIIELPRRGTEFAVKMPSNGVIRKVIFDARTPHVLLAQKDTEPQIDYVPIVVVDFDPEDTWAPRRFVVVSPNMVVHNDQFDLVYVDAPLHPGVGVFALYEVVRPGGGCLACGMPEGAVHAEDCIIAHQPTPKIAERFDLASAKFANDDPPANGTSYVAKDEPEVPS